VGVRKFTYKGAFATGLPSSPIAIPDNSNEEEKGMGVGPPGVTGDPLQAIPTQATVIHVSAPAIRINR